MGKPLEPTYCPNTLTFVENSPNNVAINSISPISADLGSSGGTLGDVKSVKSYFANNWRQGDSPTSYTQLTRMKAGLFKATYPLKINKVENDTIAIYENYRRGNGGADPVDYPGQFGIKGFSFNMVTTGYHRNQGLTAAIIDGSVNFIKTDDLVSDTEYQISSTGTWGLNEINHFYQTGIGSIAPSGAKWNWKD